MRKKILFMITLFILLLTTTVYAESEQIQLSGDDVVTTGTSQNMTIRVTNEDDAIGVVAGTITVDSNIESIEISSSYNGWTTTYNEETGAFNTFNATGTTNGGVLQITYILKDNVTEATITISDIELTTISYETITISDSITKTVTVEEDSNTNTASNASTNNETESTEYSANESTANSASSTSDLPTTGKSTFIIGAIIVLAIIIFVLYKKNVYYKNL